MDLFNNNNNTNKIDRVYSTSLCWNQ